MRRLKCFRHERISKTISICIINSRKPKKQLYIRKRMWWASCHKWDMAMLRKQLELK
jgi:hypothetical protein